MSSYAISTTSDVFNVTEWNEVQLRALVEHRQSLSWQCLGEWRKITPAQLKRALDEVAEWAVLKQRRPATEVPPQAGLIHFLECSRLRGASRSTSQYRLLHSRPQGSRPTASTRSETS
jgi:hypothetical protein